MKRKHIIKCHSINIEGPLTVDNGIMDINDYFGKNYNTQCFKVTLQPLTEDNLFAKSIVRHFFCDSHSLIFNICEEALEQNLPVKLAMTPITITLPFGVINKELMNNTLPTLILQDEINRTVMVFETYMQDKLFYTIPREI